MRGKMKISLAAAALSGSLFATSAFAKENRAHHQRDLVGLGDSITFGYNLGANNNQPSQYAFPFLMGEDTHLHVRDLGIPGWTTSDLLNAIKHNEQFRD